ncbi:MAG TPA: hypothetical protein VJ814_04235 [Gaiellaceae bacterium]|nr:hypothetical protein [Gaiellaceae bacterium]
MRRRLFIGALVAAALLLAALGASISLVRRARIALTPALALERSTAL